MAKYSPTRPLLYFTLLAVILFLAAFLRFYHLDSSSLWSDEGNTWALMSRDFGEIARLAAADIHPPGYYWLLKLWSLPFGTSAFALRSFSAVAGILLVFTIERIARLVAPPGAARRWLSLLAALLAAVNCFQVYYSQEARMYMLLALESAGLFWALFAMRSESQRTRGEGRRWRLVLAEIGFVLCGSAGLWTHYSFFIVLAAADLTAVTWWLIDRRKRTANVSPHPDNDQPRPNHSQFTIHNSPLFRLIILNLLILLTFLPWLPTAVSRVLNWPKGGVSIGLFEGIVLTLRTLLFGPLHSVPEPLWPWLLLSGVLPIMGILALRRHATVLALALWLLMPVGLMFALGLFSEAFLKFLLVTSPAWCLLAAAAPFQIGTRMNTDEHGLGSLKAPCSSVFIRVLPILSVSAAILVAAFGVAAAWVALPAYYNDPAARDNYKGVAAYLRAVGDPAADLVVLDAPGQQEAWRFYDPGLPVLALPAQRPPDAAQTEAQLAQAMQDRRRIYALFWATDEADPDQIVERWLDRQAFKGIDAWQGNLRFVAYALANDLQRQEVAAEPFGDQIALFAQEQPAFAQRVAAGDVALVRLWWRALRRLETRYKVTVQLLDMRDQVIAQRDSEPAGGAQPTNTWTVGEPVQDNHGLFIPFGTPPGEYRLIAALYDPATGARLTRNGQDFVDLGKVVVDPPADTVPLDVISMQHRLNQTIGPVILAGYAAHRKGFDHAPATPIRSGDTVHFTFYWQAPDPLPTDWPSNEAFTLRLGDQQLTALLAGGSHPTGRWQPGELVRGEFDLVYDGTSDNPAVEIDGNVVSLAPLPR